MWRHGDVLIAKVDCLPEKAKPRHGNVLVRGEVTGHSHRILEPGVFDLFEFGGELYLHVHADRATLVHEEHKPIVLSMGVYRVWQQREYTPQAIQRVRD